MERFTGIACVSITAAPAYSEIVVMTRFAIATFPRRRGMLVDRVVANENGYDRERFPGNFYQGMILKLDRARGRGVVRSHSGKEIPFEFPFVVIVGARIGSKMPGIDLIREGDIVGFDVGWTSRGLRITMIHPRDGAS